MLCVAPNTRRVPSLAIPRASHAACSATTRRSSSQSCSKRVLHSSRRSPRSRATGLACLARLPPSPAWPHESTCACHRSCAAPRATRHPWRHRTTRPRPRPGAPRFLQDLLGDLLIGPGRVMRRGRGDLRAINRDDTDLHHAGRGAQLKHRPEQLRDRHLMPDAEPRDRRVIGHLVGADHPERNVVKAVTLDAARRPDVGRVGVDEQRHHHRRIMRRPTPAILAIRHIERIQIKLADRLQNEPRQMVLRQPLLQARRQQQLLITIAPDEVLRHASIVLNLSDDTTVCATPSAKSSTRTGGGRDR
jgi:hypothetical protein